MKTMKIDRLEKVRDYDKIMVTAYFDDCGEGIDNDIVPATTEQDIAEEIARTEEWWAEDGREPENYLITLYDEGEIVGSVKAEVEGDYIVLEEEEATLWYAVQETSEDAWDYGSEDKDEAIRMLKAQGCGQIAVIDGDVCIEEIAYEDVCENERRSKMKERKYVVLDEAMDGNTNWDSLVGIYDTLEEANAAAIEEINHLTDRELKERHVHVEDIYEDDLDVPGEWDSFIACGYNAEDKVDSLYYPVAETEYYRSTDGSYRVHSDFIEGVEEPDEDDTAYQVYYMDEEEYDTTVLANGCIRADFEDWYGDKDARVKVIMLR